MPSSKKELVLQTEPPASISSNSFDFSVVVSTIGWGASIRREPDPVVYRRRYRAQSSTVQVWRKVARACGVPGGVASLGCSTGPRNHAHDARHNLAALAACLTSHSPSFTTLLHCGF